MKAPPIGIIEDDDAIRDSLDFLFGVRGLETRSFASAAEFLKTAPLDEFNALLVHQNLPHMRGIELIELLRSRGLQMPAMIMTGNPDARLDQRARRAGAVTVLDKPLPTDRLMAWVDATVAGTGGPGRHARGASA